MAASDKNDSFVNFSNINNITDLLAPGVDIKARGIDGKEVISSGTSISAAHVSGVVALLLANKTMSFDEARFLLRETGKEIDTGKGIYPRADAYNAFMAMQNESFFDQMAQEEQVQAETEYGKGGEFGVLAGADCSKDGEETCPNGEACCDDQNNCYISPPSGYAACTSCDANSNACATCCASGGSLALVCTSGYYLSLIHI